MLLQNIETAVEKEGDYEINYESTAYQSQNHVFEDLDVTEEDLQNLFENADGFGEDLFGGDPTEFENSF